MVKLKNLKKLEKLKPDALQIDLQPKRLLAITSELAKVQSISCKDKKYDFRLFQVDSVQKIIGEKGKSFLLKGNNYRFLSF